MRRLVLLLPLLVMAFAPPKPKVPRTRDLAVVVDEAQAATLKVRYTVSATGGPDSLIVTTACTGQTNVVKRYAGAAKTDSLLNIPRPAMGQSKTCTVTAQAKKLGVLSAASAPMAKTYTEPVVVEPPTVEGVDLLPTAATVDPRAQIIFCGVERWSDGTRRLVPSSDTIPVCRQRLASA